MNKIHVIGIGYRPLTGKASEILLSAGTILASRRLFEVFQRYEEFEAVKQKITVITSIDETMKFLQSSLAARPSSQPLVLLASGDPLFFGIGRKVLAEFGHDRVEIHPDLSSVQVAFARIKEPWDNAFLMSLHGGPDPEKRRRLPYTIDDIPSLIEKHDKIAILTDRENNPPAIAKTLIDEVRSQESGVRIFVCEKLGYPEERVTSGTPDEIAAMIFGDPNVVIIRSQESKIKSQKSEHVFGLAENEVVHSRGLITKDEVRAVSLHKLRLPRKGVFWDIGAGSGSVSVEAARLCPELKVYAIEKNEEQLSNIQRNVTNFALTNVNIISGEAPEMLTGLPGPDRVFIGGSSGKLPEVIACIMEKMASGIIVLNAVSLETLNEAISIFSNNNLAPQVSQISVSRSKIVSGQRHMTSLNPIFVIKGERK